mmetsp:Transcript_33304/g.81849  ORF Transcript_33304/g.81849 Transcript_33304/m.81849 type:complete len:181 (+) Transcript_33304:302-844(+)|eukprot:CAMPEP_0197576232 /NCGR_PEP_ID=MMETSP1326-20131121/1325_1 /TAXON_ID=1155430 /ORGANISM="Genus nov. species nov., Strain RCC2288" /LENGTH=180 /DNA_ID=CAMNT_0043139107 /DNA_START=300 /DNA_END=842 /DNA_ORIENTATION=+
MATVKLCVVGPQEGGKTMMCKLLAEAAADRQYSPTAGLRVQEVERRIGMQTVNVQLWDCSGDFKYQTCFPAMSLGMDGLIIVYNPDEEGKEPELEKWFQVFSQQGDIQLSANQCLILGLHRSETGRPRAPIQGKLRKLPNAIVEVSDAQSAAQHVGNELDKMLTHVVAMKRETEENSVMN